MGGTPQANTVAGVATFSDVRITTAGTYRLGAKSDGVTGATSTSFAITPAAADHLVFLQEPSNARLNQAITPAVRVAVHDVYSNVVTSFTDIMYMKHRQKRQPAGERLVGPGRDAPGCGSRNRHVRGPEDRSGALVTHSPYPRPEPGA